MFPFWKLAIRPVIESVEAQRILEIGALRGGTTEHLLDRLGPQSEIHVIDPVPVFDPTEHERQFPGRYLFYRDLSLNVLPPLPPMDVALIDGDHNWYTVYNELRLLRETAEAAGRPLPVLILHDVCWPYGRRDLYYNPDTIPDEFRQPYAQKGILRDKKELVPGGGLNPSMNNALVEGGPRNGVMTAVDDFVAEFDRPVRQLVIPIYFGLAIIAEEAVIDQHPALREVLDGLESAAGRAELLDLAESVRLQAMIFQHNSHYKLVNIHQRVARRYLDLMKGALLDEHYLENELRIDHLVHQYATEANPDVNALHDPIRRMKPRTRRLRAARQAGRLTDDEADVKSYFPYTTMGRVRLDRLHEVLDTIRAEDVKGDLVDTAVGRGGAAIFMRGFLEGMEMGDPQVWVADPFRATPPDLTTDPSLSKRKAALYTALGGGRGMPDLLPDLNTVREAFNRFDLLDDRVRFLQGEYRDTLPDAPIDKISLIRIGPEAGEGAAAVLDALYDRLTVGGFVIIDDYNIGASQEAVDKFRARRGVTEPIERMDWSGALWRKIAAVPAAESPSERADVPARAPTPRDIVTTKDLSVVVVFYNMKREAARTLHSLSRAYQQGIDDLDYEVIVIDNGSDADQVLGEEFVQSFGPEFRYIELGDEATSSPTTALNKGIEVAGGRAIALMIDGAHVLTPGVLRHGMLGLSAYEPSIVVTQQWYMGPGQQGDAILEGYDRELEDRLFEEIGWPVDGYKLFDIGHFIGERDWLDGLWESNCVFVPRAMIEQIGGFDDSFSMPGGGFANLDFYERFGSSPDINVTTILGEGSFHQLHGGTTTNESGTDERHSTLASYAQHYDDLRGRGFVGHRRRLHYVGTMIDEARRTRARRHVAPNYFTKAAKEGPDGFPSEPVPIPKQLKDEFLEAYWKSLSWKRTSWLGVNVQKPPADLVLYQTLIHKVRPDWIVETKAGNGGRAYFLATICDLVGHGRVLSVAPDEDTSRPEHDRITRVHGRPLEKATVEQVNEIAGGDDPNALLILCSRGTSKHTSQEFNVYSHLVPVGGYLVVEETIFNGWPVWPAFGPGPFEAVKGIVERRGDFVQDLDLMKYFNLTFNPGGFLKRVS